MFPSEQDQCPHAPPFTASAPSCLPTSLSGRPLTSKPGKVLSFYSGPNSPACIAFRWSTAYHCNDPLLLAVLEQLRRSRSLLVIQGACEASLLVAMGKLTNRLRSQRNEF